MTEIYLIRHGETEYNKLGIVQGSGVDSDLNDRGKAQARAFFDAYQHTSFDAVYCSKLKRTVQTLEPWRSLGYALHADAGLNEFSWGIHEGKKPSPEQRAVYMGAVKAWQAGDWDARVEGGESPHEAWARTRPFWDTLLETHRGQRVLLCSHGRQIRIMLAKLTGMDMEDARVYPHNNTGLSILDISEAGELKIRLLNDAQHLPLTLNPKA